MPIENILREASDKNLNNHHLENNKFSFNNIITNHSSMFEIFRTIEKVSKTKSTILITGESGTGKELVAKAIHQLSGCSGDFIAVNCGAIPENLLESELFGYEKGAFTGATNSKPGKFLLANEGTIFLDEIGDMSPNLQIKLLRVLQERVIEPVGGIKQKQVSLRVIAATNTNLLEQVEKSKFRKDLYYRLQVVPIEIPPLRERKKDINYLIKHFNKVFSTANERKELKFSEEIISIFSNYDWPGNIRELQNVIERLTVLCDSDLVTRNDLPAQMKFGEAKNLKLRFEISESGIDFNKVIEDLENSLITQALTKTNGNKKKAAELLKLNRTTLVEKIKKKNPEDLNFQLLNEC